MGKNRTVRAILSAATLGLCGALCWTTVDLYRAGLARRVQTGLATAPIFTWEDTVSRARYILPALAVWLMAALIIGEKTPKTPASGIVPTRQRAPRAPGWLRILLYAFAAALTVLGICNGGLRDVLVKAINICTECIGLG